MIAMDLPAPLMWALRWLLFLGPLGGTLILARAGRAHERKMVAGLFSFLYGFAMIFATHQLALAMGWWRYGGDVLMVMGIPADIWIGGAMLFGPVMYFAFPSIKPLLLVLPIIIGLHGTVFSSLRPLVEAGPYWFAGVMLVFLVAHIPALYLARWTARDENLPLRAALLAVAYGFLAFMVLPSLIMHAMGGAWDIVTRPLWLMVLCLPLLGICFLVGLSAVQMFVLHGEGTAIPLDKTKRLVRTGLFAYVINPMQLSTALAWIVMGIALGNIWVASASVMAWVFVAGMVRWHHRNDLLVRFPGGWPTYRANVPEWRPRWRPWIAEPATLRFDPGDPGQARIVRWLQRQHPDGLIVRPKAGVALRYTEPHETAHFYGAAAIGKALNHIHLLWALAGAAMLLALLPLRYVMTRWGKPASVRPVERGEAVRRPRSLTLGLGFLLRIKHDQLGFYDDMKDRHGDAVPLRLGPYRSWLLFHPDHVEQVLTKQWQSFIRFERLTQVVAQWTGDNMLLAEGEAWRERRRKVLPAFQTRRLPAYCAKAVDHAGRLCDSLAGQADADGRVRIDTDAVMARLTLDIASSTFFASAPPANGDEVEAAIRILSETAFRESTSPVVLPDWLPLAAKRRKRWAMAVMDRLVGGLVDARLRQDGADHGDLLSMLVEQHRADRQAIRNDAMSLLIAGHETSGALLSWIFHCLVGSPNWLGTLTAEISGGLNGRAPAAEDLASLPVLRAVVEEVLRLYPPAYSLFLRRAVEDVAMDGFTIRKGDLVQITPYTIHRDPRWFTDPTQFNPARFLNEADWPRYAYLPFGSGPRVCIGQSFGMMEACLVTATLLQRWVPSAEHGTVIPDPKFSLRPKGGLPMTWRSA